MLRSTTIFLSFLVLVILQLSYANPVTKTYPVGGGKEENIPANDPTLQKLLNDNKYNFEKDYGEMIYGKITKSTREVNIPIKIYRVKMEILIRKRQNYCDIKLVAFENCCDDSISLRRYRLFCSTRPFQ